MATGCELRQQLWEASIKNHEKYIDPATGLLKAEFVHERKCPTCGSAQSVRMFHKGGGTYVRCADCEMVFLNPVMTDQHLGDYYRFNHDLQSMVVADDTEFYHRIYLQGLSLLESCLGRQGAILDIGCSSGIFLDVARRQGWSRTMGLELNEREAEVARQKHTIYTSTLESFSPPEMLDALTLWDVFEHIKDGNTLLQAARGVLKPDGMLFIQTPSSAALAPRIMHEHCNMFDGIEHVNLYSPDTMQKIAGRNGYKVMAMQTVISEWKPIQRYLRYHEPYNDTPAGSGCLSELITEQAILDNNLGYKMQAVLKPV